MMLTVKNRTMFMLAVLSVAPFAVATDDAPAAPAPGPAPTTDAAAPASATTSWTDSLKNHATNYVVNPVKNNPATAIALGVTGAGTAATVYAYRNNKNFAKQVDTVVAQIKDKSSSAYNTVMKPVRVKLGELDKKPVTQEQALVAGAVVTVGGITWYHRDCIRNGLAKVVFGWDAKEKKYTRFESLGKWVSKNQALTAASIVAVPAAAYVAYSIIKAQQAQKKSVVDLDEEDEESSQD